MDNKIKTIIKTRWTPLITLTNLGLQVLKSTLITPNLFTT